MAKAEIVAACNKKPKPQNSCDNSDILTTMFRSENSYDLLQWKFIRLLIDRWMVQMYLGRTKVGPGW